MDTRSVHELIDEIDISVSQSCLIRAQGNQQLADYLEDCGFYEYYWRIIMHNKYVEAQNKAIENAKRNK